MTSNDIIKSALSYTNNKRYTYWFGGKFQKCTKTLLDTLSELYPDVYTSLYKSRCKLDISSGRIAVDCSGLVCKVYRKPFIGTHEFYKYFKEYKNTPKDGMIVWRASHCGIYFEGKVIEARGLWKGITATRPYISGAWTRIYYDPKVTYIPYKNDSDVINYEKVVKDVIAGKYGNGRERINKLTSAGYDASIVQKYVNNALSSIKSKKS